MKIMCATDFTPRARAAAKVAVDLARLTAGSVELVQIVAARSSDIRVLTVDVRVLEHETRQALKDKLAAESLALAKTGGVPVSFCLGDGDVEVALREHAKAIAADLIVMGAHGRAAAARWLLGSTAERMVRSAECPVLIVPPGVEGLSPAGAERRPLQIMAALDGRRTSEGAVALARQLRARVICDVTFLRLYWPVEEYQRLGLTGTRDLVGPDPEVVTDLGRTLRTEVGVLPGEGKTAFAVEPTWGDPASGIFAAAEEHASDLIIMGAESRHGWGRIAHPAVASRVTNHAFGVPVVFVPAPPPDQARRDVPRILTVLVPTDLSPAGNHAIRFAYSLVAAHGGVVELCHVHERMRDMPPYVYDPPEGKLGVDERARLEGALRALIPADAERLGITTHVTVIDGGKAAEVIGQAAERLLVDAIVLGSHGKGGAVGLLLGSVSQSVVHRARRPVLVVPSALTDRFNNVREKETP